MRSPTEILVAAKGPILASALIALLLEPHDDAHQLAALVLEGLASFELGRTKTAESTAQAKAGRLRKAAGQVRQRGDAGYGAQGIPTDIRDLVGKVRQIVLTGDPMSDWRLVRAAPTHSPREELKHVAREARHLRLLQRRAQIQGRMAEAWRAYGTYRDAREHLAAAVIEDQFAATIRPHRKAAVTTIHKAKGKEFDEVIVFEGV